MRIETKTAPGKDEFITVATFLGYDENHNPIMDIDGFGEIKRWQIADSISDFIDNYLTLMRPDGKHWNDLVIGKSYFVFMVALRDNMNDTYMQVIKSPLIEFN